MFLVEIFHDLTCQDLPPAIEDEFFALGLVPNVPSMESRVAQSRYETTSLTSQVKTENTSPTSSKRLPKCSGFAPLLSQRNTKPPPFSLHAHCAAASLGLSGCSRPSSHATAPRCTCPASVLAVVQQRLVPSKINDARGFELLCAVVMHVPPTDLRQYFKTVVMSLLTWMHTNKMDNFVYLFAWFVLFSMAIKVKGLTPDYTIGAIEEIQSQWPQILNNFVVPQVTKLPHKDRKIGAIGLTRMLTGCENPPRRGAHQDRLQTAGYHTAYSRLAASKSTEADPVAYAQDPQQYLGQQLVEPTKGGAPVKNLVGPFVQSMAAAEYAF
ncbi:CAS/CSE protein [Infundibulicybe gibba]|nr:CAS/CSE protein [Infundibulicybe gibba]